MIPLPARASVGDRNFFPAERVSDLETWRGDGDEHGLLEGQAFLGGKVVDHPEIMSQGRTLKELEANLKEAFLLMAMDDVPEEYKVKTIAIP